MIDFDIVPVNLILDEIKPNVARHYSEMSTGDDYGSPDIDWNYYEEIGAAGQCVAVTARDEGRLIAYSVYSLSINPRYKSRIEANSDGIFIEKEYRGRLGNFPAKADDFLRNLGVMETNYTSNDKRVGAFLSRNGYEPKYTIWSMKYGQ